MLCFTVDVHVRAEKSVNYEGIIQEPNHCLELLSPSCAFFLNKRNKYTQVLDPHNLYVLNHRGVLRKEGRALHLLEGDLLVYSKKDQSLEKKSRGLKIETHFADVSIHDGRMIATANPNNVVIYNLDAEIILTHTNGEKTQLPKGSQVELKKIGAQGKIQMEYPTSISLKSLLKIWSKLTVYSPSKFKKQVTQFYPHWRSGVDEGAFFHRKVIERHVAEAEVRRKRRKAYRKKVEQENEMLRNMLKRRNYLDN